MAGRRTGHVPISRFAPVRLYRWQPDGSSFATCLSARILSPRCLARLPREAACPVQRETLLAEVNQRSQGNGLRLVEGRGINQDGTGTTGAVAVLQDDELGGGRQDDLVKLHAFSSRDSPTANRPSGDSARRNGSQMLLLLPMPQTPNDAPEIGGRMSRRVTTYRHRKCKS